MNRQNIPLILMLVAGAITCIINLIERTSTLTQMASLLIVLVVFYFLGSVLKWTLDSFDEQNDRRRQEAEKAAGENGEDTEEKENKSEQ